MKILFINNLGTIHGGAETMIAQLRRGLTGKGHEVRVISGDEQGNGALIADYRFKSFKGNSPLKIFYVFNPFAVFLLWKVLRKYKPDIVHLHNVSKASPFILLLLKKYSTVLTIHDHMVFDPTRIKDTPLLVPYKKSLGDYFINSYSLRFFLERLRFFFFRRFAKYINTTLACSDFYAQCAKDSGMFKNVKSLYNGIGLQNKISIENWNNILFVGRLDRAKGVHILLEAMPKIINKHPDVCVYIAGTGTEDTRLRKEAERLAIDKAVRFEGHQSIKQIQILYRKATLVVVPSLWPEPFGLVGIEALSFGRAVVASRVGGIPEWLKDRESGFLVDRGNPEQIAEKINLLLSNKELLADISKSARKKAEQFSVEKFMKNTEEVYSNVINKRSLKLKRSLGL